MLIADYEYCCSNMENLPLPNKVQLSKQLKHLVAIL